MKRRKRMRRWRNGVGPKVDKTRLRSTIRMTNQTVATDRAYLIRGRVETAPLGWSGAPICHRSTEVTQ
eukprot:7156695-Pyramimonas_sp.AAC.1